MRHFNTTRRSRITSATLTIALTLAGCCLLHAQTNRAVYLIHGHPGNTRSLANAGGHITANAPALNGGAGNWDQIAALKIADFESNRGVAANAGAVATLMRTTEWTEGTAPGRSIAFGSSYGGLVARRIAEFAWDDHIGGVITHGTPNTGSPIANNIDDVVPWALESLADVGEPFALEFIEDGRILGTFLGRRSVRWAIDELFGLGQRFLVDLQNAPATQDIRVGSPTLTALNAAPEPVEGILTFAEEQEEDLVFRVLGAPLETLQSAPFTANDDPGVEVAANIHAQVRQREAVWRVREANSSWYGDWFNGRYYSRREMRDLRNSFMDANRTLQLMDAEYKLNAGFTEVRNTGPGRRARCTCFPEDAPPRLLIARNQVECESIRDPGCAAIVWEPAQPSSLEVVYIPNDGIVPVASQRAFDTPWQIPMIGDNHFTSNNSTRFRDVLDIIFEGRSNNWFDTTP